MKRNQTRPLIIINVSLLILGLGFEALTKDAIALFLPLIRADLAMTFAQGGTMSAARTLVYALMQVPAGYLADRFGAKRLFVIGVLGTTLFSLHFGMVTEYWQALANQTLSGFFRALLFAPGLSLIIRWFPPERRATVMGLYIAGAVSGGVVIDIVGPLLLAKFSWRFPFLGFSSLGIIASFILWRFAKEPPGNQKGEVVNLREVLQLFRHRVMWVCNVIQFVRLAVFEGIGFWLPSLLIDEKGLSLQITGLLVALRIALSAPSNILGGYASDRLKNPTFIIGLALTMLMITTALLVVLNNVILLAVVLAINGIFVQMYLGPLYTVPIEIFGTRIVGTSAGFSNLFAQIGAFTSIYVLGVLKDASGSFLSGFFAIAIVCVIGLGFTLLLARMRRAAIAKSSPN